MLNLAKITKQIISVEDNRRNFAAQVRDLSSHLITSVPKLDEPKLKICGVDGGFLKKEYHGAGLILRRAVAVCFEYENNKLLKSDYFPNKNPPPEPLITGPEFSEQEFSNEADLKRVELELKTAIESAIKFKPDLLILDGSIFIHPSNIPPKDSKVWNTYKEVVNLYKHLYITCETENILLVGVIEDSRSKRFCGILNNQNKDLEVGLRDMKDTLLLYYLLEIGERTHSFKYSSSNDLPSMNTIESWGDQFYAMYLKSAEFDRPMRVEFLTKKDPEEVANKVSAILHKISGYNRHYCYPSVIIEADARAKLTEREILMFKQKITEKIGHNPSLFELRRETRPF